MEGGLVDGFAAARTMDEPVGAERDDDKPGMMGKRARRIACGGKVDHAGPGQHARFHAVDDEDIDQRQQLAGKIARRGGIQHHRHPLRPGPFGKRWLTASGTSFWSTRKPAS